MGTGGMFFGSPWLLRRKLQGWQAVKSSRAINRAQDSAQGSPKNRKANPQSGRAQDHETSGLSPMRI